MNTPTARQERQCDAWVKAGEHLRAAVAWRVYRGQDDVLSAFSGVPYGALTKFVETGELKAHYRTVLEGLK